MFIDVTTKRTIRHSEGNMRVGLVIFSKNYATDNSEKAEIFSISETLIPKFRGIVS